VKEIRSYLATISAGCPGPDPVEAGGTAVRDGPVRGERHALRQDPLLLRGGGAQVHGAPREECARQLSQEEAGIIAVGTFSGQAA